MKLEDLINRWNYLAEDAPAEETCTYHQCANELEDFAKNAVHDDDGMSALQWKWLKEELKWCGYSVKLFSEDMEVVEGIPCQRCGEKCEYHSYERKDSCRAFAECTQCKTVWEF